MNPSPAVLDKTFSALADPTRRAILSRLARGESSAGELAAPFEMSWPAISKHLRVLESAGLMKREKDGRVHRCRLESGPMKDAAEWIAFYRQFWEGQLDSLADYLDNTLDKEKQEWPERKAGAKPPSASRVRSTRRAKKSSGPGRSRKR